MTSTKTTTIVFACEVAEDAVVTYNDSGKMIITFTREVELFGDGDVAEELGDLQSDLLWECFDSSLEVVE
jgi:hypothetical protein